MANLKEVRDRISSVSSTRQITSAMKMVSAAKLKRAQDAIIRLRPYASKLKEILQNLSASLESSPDGVYSEEREVKNVLIIAVTSNRGLCGGFNSAVLKLVNKTVEAKYSALKGSGKIHAIGIGKKASDFFNKSEDFNLVNSFDSIYDNLDFEHVSPIALEIMAAFAEGKYDRVELVYNQFKNAATQVNTVEQYLLSLRDKPKIKN
jgi:F-type H+-transporting ATPase subunit gamma